MAVAVVPCPVLRRRLTDDLGEPGAEGSERSATHGSAGIGHRHAMTQEGLAALDASRHEVGVGRFAVDGSKLSREVCRRHVRRTCHRRYIEGLGVLTVDEVTCATQMDKVSQLLSRHGGDGRPPEPQPSSRASDSSSLATRRHSTLGDVHREAPCVADSFGAYATFATVGDGTRCERLDTGPGRARGGAASRDGRPSTAPTVKNRAARRTARYSPSWVASSLRRSSQQDRPRTICTVRTCPSDVVDSRITPASETR